MGQEKELSAFERVASINPALAEALAPSLADADYNREYERLGLSAWESPEYRPYCLCRTMRRMEHRDYGYQCSVCFGKCDFKGEALGPTGDPS